MSFKYCMCSIFLNKFGDKLIKYLIINLYKF